MKLLAPFLPHVPYHASAIFSHHPAYDQRTFTVPNCLRITTKPRNIQLTHIILCVKRELHVSATKSSLDQAIHRIKGKKQIKKK